MARLTTKTWLKYLVCNCPATRARFISEAISATRSRDGLLVRSRRSASTAESC